MLPTAQVAPPGLTLQVDDPEPGTPMTMRVTGASPGQRVYLGVTPRGERTDFLCPAGFAECIDIRGPVTLIGSNLADSSGTAVFSATPPPNSDGTPLWFQALTVTDESDVVHKRVGSTMGEATWYTFTFGGDSCQITTANDSPTVPLRIAAPPGLYASNQRCGVTVEIDASHAEDAGTHTTCAGGVIEAVISDACPSCAPGQLDLSAEALAALQMPAGCTYVDQLAWRIVEPSGVVADIEVELEAGSSQWWIGLTARNLRYRLERVEFEDATGAWVLEMVRGSNNRWTLPITPSQPLQLPFTLTMYDAHGNDVDGQIFSFNGGWQSLNTQFPAGYGAP